MANDEQTTVTQTRWDVVVALAVMIFMFGLDMTIAATALPAIGRDLAVDTVTTQWVQLGYLLPSVALIVPAGRWLETTALRPALLLGVSGFGIGSLLAALAPAFPALVAARAVQGASGAILAALMFPTVAAVVRADQRGRAFGTFAALGPVGAVAGPVLGGMLLEVWAWPAIFLAKLPVVAIAGVLVVRAMPAGGRLPRPRRDLLVDVIGLGGAVAAGFVVLDRIGSVTGMGWVVVVLLTVVGLAAGRWWSVNPVSRPVVEVLRSPRVRWPAMTLLLGSATSGAVFFLAPHLLTGVLDHGPGDAGLALVALPALMAVTSPVAGLLADRNEPGPIVVAGAAMSLAGALLLVAVGPDATLMDVAWRLAVLGVGSGVFTGPNSVMLLRSSPAGATATVGSVVQAVRSLGFAVGPAVGALAWSVSGGGIDGFRLGTAAASVLAGVMVVSAVAAQRSSLAGRSSQPAT